MTTPPSTALNWQKLHGKHNFKVRKLISCVHNNYYSENVFCKFDCEKIWNTEVIKERVLVGAQILSPARYAIQNKNCIVRNR